ncbi:MAG TPA: XrtB/PEP-CTERM-associated polysaccharide biosynthesis outer membrane protein EpsL [Burkholderiaceae bacterium]|nr:XrtB/PEP-CTERM-associated polysaccharide biosynthesis outer membrane protein EpsL [Burkholderiaceae bacterium]
MTIRRFASPWIAAAFAAMPVAALAQLVLPPVGTQVVPQGPAQATQDQDVLTFDVGGGAERHSNIFLLPAGVDPTPLFGRPSRSDTVLRGLVGVNFERIFSLQRIRLDARVEPTKFVEHSRFDYVGYNAGGTWDWQVGRPLFGQVGIRLRRMLAPFDAALTTQRNMEDRRNLRAAAGFRFTPSWAVLAGVEHESLDNSVAVRRGLDYQFLTAEAGVRYAPGTGTEIDFVYRRTDGDYPNRQVFDALGNLLPAAIDNQFKQDAFLARLQIRPNEDSRIQGTAGYVQRKFDNLPQRDFSGPTAGIDVDWAPTGALVIRTSLVRDIYTEELITANYVDVRTLAVRPLWRVTGRISLLGNAVFSQRTYKGDPGFVLTGAQVRKDDFTALGVQVHYEFTRTILATAELRRDRRSSNYPGFDFTDNVAAVGLRARF